ncbi:cytochrome P450 [Haloarcula salinisoli]|uniref:Cytochrome P450 n=1 Tax=Haloarcula salinisoli TaxID=2487746 RepID=A0A8J7YE69_9EURY|nr:cytochrome P450 [Halomicroarcula salinisoli]MBX0303832.1 cytochrome P450 [Halomicroarcula salinisoli]
MSRADSPPTPPGLPLVGNGWAFSRRPVDAMESWADHGDLVELRFPGQSLYMVSGPDLVEQILVDQHDRFTIGPRQQATFEGIEDHAVTTATGDRWKRLRRALHPAFTPDRLQQYGDRMTAVTARFVDDWAEGDRLDLTAAMRALAVQLLADSLVGADLRGEEDVVIAAADALVARTNFRRPGQLLPDWVPTPTDRRFRRSVTELDELVDGLLADREAGAGEDVLSVLLEAHERGDLSMAEVRHNLVGLLLAGHESPSNALASAWRLLSDHGDVLDELVAEYDAVVDGDRPTAAEFEALTRTRNVVRETLRLYPPTTGVNRMATTDVTLDGYTLSAGSQLFVPQWVLHRDERFWTDPERFDPDRWARDTTRPDHAYIPFSAGPRACIGADFARRELTLALATMVGRVALDVEVDGPLTFTPSLSLRPEQDITATVHRR